MASECRQGLEHDDRLPGQPLCRLPGPVTPGNLKAERCSAVGVPAIRRYEADRLARQAQAIDRELIHFGRRLEDADRLDR